MRIAAKFLAFCSIAATLTLPSPARAELNRAQRAACIDLRSLVDYATLVENHINYVFSRSQAAYSSIKPNAKNAEARKRAIKVPVLKENEAVEAGLQSALYPFLQSPVEYNDILFRVVKSNMQAFILPDLYSDFNSQHVALTAASVLTTIINPNSLRSFANPATKKLLANPECNPFVEPVHPEIMSVAKASSAPPPPRNRLPSFQVR